MTEPPKKDPQEDRILDHEYDGIREYDNPMPRWWVILFFLAFLAIVLRVMAPSRKSEMDRMARLPLDDDEHPSPGAHT